MSEEDSCAQFGSLSKENDAAWVDNAVFEMPYPSRDHMAFSLSEALSFTLTAARSDLSFDFLDSSQHSNPSTQQSSPQLPLLYKKLWKSAQYHQQPIEMSERYIPEHRRTQFKAKNTFKPDELRRRREEQQVEIRKAKREENLAKRRGIAGRDGAPSSAPGASLGASVDSDDEGGTIESQVCP